MILKNTATISRNFLASQKAKNHLKKNFFRIFLKKLASWYYICKQGKGVVMGFFECLTNRGIRAFWLPLQSKNTLKLWYFLPYFFRDASKRIYI